jgi:L-Lysine epsilon oxidase N-terminal/L-lysine epsilon oxidase C-terminal domain
MAGSTDTTYAIHPAVGIARVGNAEADVADPSSFYLGAEAPYEVPNQGQPYKSGGKIKKQAQRFRIYEFQAGKATREITLQQEDVAGIEWTVHLANRKAALDTDADPGTPSKPTVVPPAVFTPIGSTAPTHYWPATTRNAPVAAADRARLCIDAGPQSVGGAVTQRDLSGAITFPDSPSKAVTLGRLCTEPGTGRLLVFAADGLSEGLLDGTFSPLPKLTDWGNNDQWYDDTADGWVRARIAFRDGTEVTLDQPDQSAWVLCAAPRFTPAFNCFTSLHDVSIAVAPTSGEGDSRPSFARDIYPVLRSISVLGWISARGSVGHGTGRGGYYLSLDRLRLMSDNDPSPGSDPYKARQAVFARIRDPNKPAERAGVQKYMPQVSGDITKHVDRPYEIAAVTRLQYAMLRKWAGGDFEADGVPAYVPLDKMDVAEQPPALDLAALESSAGTPFYPGIESWRIMAAPELYSSPSRIGEKARPGDLTMGNALPWQADFLDCNDIWWPIQRPNEVTREGQPLQPWVPAGWIPEGRQPDYNKMAEGWWRLGFVVTRDDGATYEEAEGTAGAQDG